MPGRRHRTLRPRLQQDRHSRNPRAQRRHKRYSWIRKRTRTPAKPERFCSRASRRWADRPISRFAIVNSKGAATASIMAGPTAAVGRSGPLANSPTKSASSKPRNAISLTYMLATRDTRSRTRARTPSSLKIWKTTSAAAVFHSTRCCEPGSMIPVWCCCMRAMRSPRSIRRCGSP